MHALNPPSAPRAARFRFALALLFLSYVLNALVTPATVQAQEPASLPEALEALAVQEQAISNGRVRLREAAAASDAAWSAFTAADQRMRDTVATEVKNSPALREVDYAYYAAGLAADIATALADRRGRLAEMRQTLAGIAREEETWRLAGRTEPHRLRPLLEYGIALLEANERWLSLLGDSLARAETARAAREQALRALRDRVSGLKRAEQALRDAELNRHRLIHTISTRFAPVHVRSVSIALAGDPRAHDAWSYRAEITQPEAATELDRQIQFMIEAVADAQAELTRYRSDFLEAEQRFIDVGRRVDLAHAANTDLVVRAYRLRVGLEVADSLIGMAKDGFEPAGVLFEAGWRIIECAQTESYRIEEPKIDAALADYRDDVAQRLGALNHLPAEARLLNDEQWLRENAGDLLGRAQVFATTGQRVAAHIRGEQADEAVKGLFNVGVVDGVKAFAHAAIARGWRPDTFKGFLNSWLFEERIDNVKLANWLSENTVEKLPLPTGVSEWLRGGDATREVLRTKRGALAEYGKAKVKDFAFGAAVTAVKEGISARQQNAMLEAATDLALLDIEWFIRRYEYSVRNAAYRAFARRLAEVEASIGALFEEKARIAPVRTFSVQAEETISTTDTLRVRVEFSRGVDEARLRAAGREHLRFANDQAILEWELEAGTFPAGDHELGLAALSRRLGAEFSFDADPITAARYAAEAEASGSATSRFVGFEAGSDARYRLRFASPTLTILDPKPGGYLTGDWLDIACELPGSLARRRMYVTATPVDRPVEIELAAGAQATLRFPAPDRPGAFQLLLLGRGQSIAHAGAKFAVPVRVAQKLDESRFVRIDALPLADRGPTFTPSAAPPAAGKGRLAFEIRDAASQLINPRVSVRVAGSEEEFAYTYGGYELDLPPRDYDVVVNAAVPIVRNSAAVRAGEILRVSTGGYGRITFDTRDALGAGINPRVSVRRAGTDTELTYTYGGNSIDLPPDTYDIVVNATPAIEHGGIPVRAGAETVVTTSGYGRLQLDARDALGQPINPRVSIRLAGKTEEFAYTYGSNFIDLPPDRYDVTYTYTPPIEFTGIALEAGKVATRTAGGYGRLQVNVLDARGEPATPRVSIHRGSEDEFTYTYGNNYIDLPPGAYVCVIGSGDEAIRAPVVLTRGATTTTLLRLR